MLEKFFPTLAVGAALLSGCSVEGASREPQGVHAEMTPVEMAMALCEEREADPLAIKAYTHCRVVFLWKGENLVMIKPILEEDSNGEIGKLRPVVSGLSLRTFRHTRGPEQDEPTSNSIKIMRDGANAETYRVLQRCAQEARF
jgi:hypothetical protein